LAVIRVHKVEDYIPIEVETTLMFKMYSFRF